MLSNLGQTSMPDPLQQLRRGKCGMQKHPEQQNSIGFVIPSKQDPDVMSWIYDDLCMNWIPKDGGLLV